MEIDYEKETAEERKARLESIDMEPSVEYMGIATEYDFDYEPVGIRDFLKLFGIDIKKIKYKLQGKEMPKYDERGRELGKI